jgi:hypothetical protein
MDLVDVTLNVVEHRWDREKLAEWIERHSVPLELPE